MSFPDGQGNWGTPMGMGPAFNSPDDEFGAMLSPDGKRLFYTRHTIAGSCLYMVDAAAIDAQRIGLARERGGRIVSGR